MPNIPSISAAESAVMEALWRTHPLTTEDVIAALKSSNWRDPTIKTLLGRLLKKGVITAQQDGRRYLYSPVLQRRDWLSSESKSLLDRLFGGRVTLLVAHFSKQLSKSDLAELKRLIAELDAEH